MTTAAEIIEDALSMILVDAAEAPLSAPDEQIARRLLNDMVFAWESNGIVVGWNEVETVGDVVTVANYANLAIKTNLAILLAKSFGKAVTQELFKDARDTKSALAAKVVRLVPTPMPDTLPVGSGNDQWSQSDTFYSGSYSPK